MEGDPKFNEWASGRETIWSEHDRDTSLVAFRAGYLAAKSVTIVALADATSREARFMQVFNEVVEAYCQTRPEGERTELANIIGQRLKGF